MDDEERIERNRRDATEALKEVVKVRREKAARWQKIQVDQFGYSLNLFITFAVATLGYCFQVLRDPNYRPHAGGRFFLGLSMMLLLSSVVFGGRCILNRLWDFRATAERARDSKDAPSLPETRAMGKLTWRLFYFELISLCLGTFALAVSLMLTYWH